MQHFQEASPEQWSHKAPCRHDIIERSYTFQTEQILYRCLVASWLIQNAIFGPRLVKQQLDDARCVEDSYDAKVALKGSLHSDAMPSDGESAGCATVTLC